MKRQILTLSAVAALITGCGTTESQLGMSGVQFDEMPMAAQSTVRQEIGSAQILDIDKERRTGETVYEVTYQEAGGIERKLHVTEDGNLFADREAGFPEAAGAEYKTETKSSGYSASAGTSSTSANYDTSSGASYQASAATTTSEPSLGTRFKDVPMAVQNAIKQHAPNAQIDDIDKERRTGRTVYEVTFKDEGLNPKIHVAEDGTILSKAEASAFQADYNAPSDRIEAKREVRGGAEALTQGPARSTIREPSGAEYNAEADLSADTTGVEVKTDADLSHKAEADIKADADLSADKAGAELDAKADLSDEHAAARWDKEGIEAKREVRGGAEALTQGPTFRSSEAEIENEAAGAEIKADATLDESATAKADVDVSKDSAGAEARMTEVRFEELPEAVKSKIQDLTDDSKYMKVRKTMRDGKTVYEVKFKEFQISEDGTVMDFKGHDRHDK